MDNKAMDNQRTKDHAELEQAMLAGTDEAAARQEAVWSRIAAGRAKPRRSPAGPLALAAAAVAVAAVLFFGLPGRLPQADLVRPMTSGTAAAAAQADISLSANVLLYAPTMSSVQGITVTARDGQGNAVEGDWATSWGVFLGPVSELGNLVPSDAPPAATLQSADRALWAFPMDSPLDPDDIPRNIEITFTAGDRRTATMALERDRELTGFVRVVQPLEVLNLRVNMNGYTYDPTRNSLHYLRIEAVDASANPVSGKWEASYGMFMQDEERGRLAQDRTWVWWAFEERDEAAPPSEASITFTALDGSSKTLHLLKDTNDSWKMTIVPEELIYIPMEPATTQPVSTEPTPIPATDPSGPAPTDLELSLPEWPHGVDFDAENLPLAEDAQPERYRKYAGGFPRHPTQDVGTVALPEGWDLRVEGKDEITVLDETGRAIGSFACRWLDTDQVSSPADFYSPLLDNHTGVISLQKLNGYPWTTYRLLLQADNGTAASGIPGVTVKNRTVFLPGTAVQKDGKTYALAYMLTLDKAVTGNGPTEYLLSNETIDFIAASWEPPAPNNPEPTPATRLTAQQTVEAYFQAWHNKDSTLMRGFVVDNMKNIDHELDKLKDITLLSCEDQTAGRRQMFSSAWYANPADIAIFHVRFECSVRSPTVWSAG